MKNKLLKEINSIAYNHINVDEFRDLLPIDSVDKAQEVLIKIDDSNFQNLIRDYRLIEVYNKEPEYSRLGREFQILKKNCSNLIIKYIRYDISRTTQKVINILSSISDNSYMVGGSIRDILLFKKPKDFDFVTDISYDTLVNVFKDNGFSIKEAGKQFLVLIVSKDGQDFEIANFRKDGTYKDGRRPEFVEIGTIFDDAQRRDFTINALYFNLKDSQLEDPNLQGIFDIKDELLKFIGNPDERINEDKLRVMRFYRFLKKTEFEPDKNSLKAARKNFEVMLKETASERIKNEIENMVGL